jgi:uncharacterized SAM-binding protein YcdF (DUF218 family)
MRTDNKQKINAVVILGGGISAEGILSSATKKRLDHLLDANIQGGTPIILSGKWNGFTAPNPPTTEAEGMRKYLVERGADVKQIILETESLDTISNAVFVKRIIEARSNWRTILLVTSDWHMGRALWIFQRILGGDYRVVPSPVTSDEVEKIKRENYEKYLLNIAKRLLEGISGRSKELIEMLRAEHPFYSKSEKAQKLLKEVEAEKEKISP